MFLNYHKDENISETTKYEDRFVTPSYLIYMSKSNRNMQSPDVLAIREQAQTGMRMPLFVKKSDDEGSEFYYLGELQAVAENFEATQMTKEDGKSVSVVRMEFKIDREIEPRLYKYLTDF